MGKDELIERTQDSFVARYERAALIAIGSRLPRWVMPDGLTAFGVFGAVLVMLGYILSNHSVHWLWLANLGLVFHWFGDSLDGTVARLRKIERPRYGFFIDQNIDVVTNLMIALGVGFSAWLRMDVALLALTGYHMLSIHTFVSSVVTRKMQVDVRGLGPTEMRLAILAMNLLIAAFGAAQHQIWGLTGTIWDVLTVLLAVFLAGLFLIEVAIEATALRREGR